MSRQVRLQPASVRAEHIDGKLAQALIDSSPECVKLLDPCGRLRYMSENGLASMQIDDYAKVDGALWWDLWPEESRTVLRQAVETANRGVTVCFEAECPTAAGVDKHWRVRVSQVKGGLLDGMVLAASEDISDAVRERLARERLDRENEALRRFTHLIAHDLRNPIRQLKVLADLALIESPPPEDEKREPTVVEHLGTTADTLLNLLNGLEALHDHANELRGSEPVSLRDVARRALAILEDSGSTVVLDIDGDARVLGNAGLLTSMFLNLFENSKKYHDGAGDCAVRVVIAEASSPELEIVVRDNGPGFAEDRVDEVFMPLVRQSNSTGKPGSGIGLSLVRSVVHKHGGQVEVLPPGDGAALRMTLPAPREAA